MNKTILVGDIGSTKSTWVYSPDVNLELHLGGYNPVTQSENQGNILVQSLKANSRELSFATIWYYGAGVLDSRIAKMVHDHFKSAFPDSLIEVNTDLTGAAYAACGQVDGTVAILGTGSHAAHWDGKRIVKQAVSLGYLLGDEGGGCDIGKALLQHYFYKTMPTEISKDLDEQLKGDRSTFLQDLQSSEKPNQFLAGFARFAVLHEEHEWIQALVSDRFKLFINRHVLPLHPTGDVHVVGSIGCIFASLIKKELEKNGLSAGTFIKDPARRLFERHTENG
jgi:glucosamine kinase